MEKNILRIPPVSISQEDLLSALQISGGDERAEAVDRMRREAQEIARPIALYAPLHPEIGDGEIRLNGVRFGEAFVREMLSEGQTVVPYVATCGSEIEAWAKQFSGPADCLAANRIMEICLFKIRDSLHDEVKKRYFDASKNISAINPGSLKEWPLSGQIQLFEALGGAREIGVSLSEDLWMSPVKSVSGILFQTDVAYENCQLCPRPDCPNRRAEFVG